MSAPILNQADLHRLLDYNQRTGIFRWRLRTDVPKSWNTRYANKVAGYAWTPSPANVTYWVIRIHDWPFLAHRLAWLYMTAEWPENDIDHRDLDGLNNRWGNLRPATKMQNSHNRRASRNNRLGMKGVCAIGGRYRATLSVDGRQVVVGVFDTAEQAQEAYREAIQLHRPEYGRAE